MRKSSKERAQKILDNYLETNNHRKTPERYAVLESVYSMKGHFSLEALRESETSREEKCGERERVLERN